MRTREEDITTCIGCLFLGIIIVALPVLSAAIITWVWNGAIAPYFLIRPVNFWLVWGILFILGIVGNRLRGK